MGKVRTHTRPGVAITRSVEVVPISTMIVPGVLLLKSRSKASALYTAIGLSTTWLGVMPKSWSMVRRSSTFSLVIAKMPTSISGESGVTNVW